MEANPARSDHVLVIHWLLMGTNMTKDEALRLALEALEYHTEQTRPIPYTIAAIVKIKKVLLQQEAKDEPVAWFWFDERDGGEWIHIADNQINANKFGNAKVIPLYATPPQRTWVGLTNDEVNDFAAGCHLGNSVQGAIYKAEAKLKDKNT